MKKFIKSLFFTLLVVSLIGSSSLVYAEESTDENYIPEMIIDGDKVEGEIIDEGEDFYTVSYFIPADDIGSVGRQGKAWPGYSMRNLKTGSTTTNFNLLISNDIVTKSATSKITVKWSRTTEISGSAAISSTDLNSKIGFAASATVSLSKSFTYTCPSTVKSCELRYYPRITKYTFDEYFLEMYQGSKSGTVFTGFEQTVTFRK